MKKCILIVSTLFGFLISCGNGMLDVYDEIIGDLSVSGVDISRSLIVQNKGTTEQLTVTILPVDATNKNVAWKSTNPAIASVSANGLVTAVESGEAEITVTSNDGNHSKSCSVIVTLPGEPGYKQTFSADGTSFRMAYVPSAAFPTGIWDDEGNATVDEAYWIGETEVTYELWNVVYTWALANGYTIANPGSIGNDSGAGKTHAHPVANVNWRDAMVWTNALTEWYNNKNGTSYTCVYTYSGDVIRISKNGITDVTCDNAVRESGATGFRLMASNEWELAARWRRDDVNNVSGFADPWFTYGCSASGATGPVGDSTATCRVAVYDLNSNSSTAEVKSKTCNALGLYDMSGNLLEWCFEWHPTYVNSRRIIRGGSYLADAVGLQIGAVFPCNKYWANSAVGFRIAKTDP